MGSKEEWEISNTRVNYIEGGIRKPLNVTFHHSDGDAVYLCRRGVWEVDVSSAFCDD